MRAIVVTGPFNDQWERHEFDGPKAYEFLSGHLDCFDAVSIHDERNRCVAAAYVSDTGILDRLPVFALRRDPRNGAVTGTLHGKVVILGSDDQGETVELTDQAIRVVRQFIRPVVQLAGEGMSFMSANLICRRCNGSGMDPED